MNWPSTRIEYISVNRVLNNRVLKLAERSKSRQLSPVPFARSGIDDSDFITSERHFSSHPGPFFSPLLERNLLSSVSANKIKKKVKATIRAITKSNWKSISSSATMSKQSDSRHFLLGFFKQNAHKLLY